jgi:hypothetical protein
MTNCVSFDDHMFIVFGAIVLTTIIVSLIAGVIGLSSQKDKLQKELNEKNAKR